MKDRDFSQGRKYIGASDMATLAGLVPQRTPRQMWEELTGRSEGFSGNKRTYWGNRQEPLILGEYIKKITGERAARNDFITSRMWGERKYEKFHSWTEAFANENERFVSHADLLDLSGKVPVIIQAKNTGEFAAAQRKRDPNKGYDRDDLSGNGIPLSAYFQEQWELYTYGIQHANVAVLIDGWDWKLYGTVEFHKKTVEKLVALAERMLWHVDNDVMPTPQNWDDVVAMYPDFKKNTKAVVSDDAELECRQMLEEHFNLGVKEKEISHRKDDIKNALGLYIGENNYLETPEGYSICSASEISGRESISVSELKKVPDLFKQVEEAGLIKIGDPYRNLYIKGVAAGNIDKYTLLTTEDGTKWKKSRKKYSSDEKKEAAALLKSLKIDCKWEKI